MSIFREIESKGMKWLVSETGEVKTPAHEFVYKRTRNNKTQEFTAKFREHTLAPCKTRTGYLEVSAKKQGKRIKHLLHRLIAMAWVPGYQEDLTVNHIDGNKTNNSINNLEWVSLARNSQHEWETGLVNLRGENHPGSKLTSKQVVYIRRMLAQGISANAIAVITNLSSETIYKISNGKTWAHLKDADSFSALE